MKLQEHFPGLFVTTVNGHIDGDTVGSVSIVGIDLQNLVKELKRLLVKLLFLREQDIKAGTLDDERWVIKRHVGMHVACVRV